MVPFFATLSGMAGIDQFDILYDPFTPARKFDIGAFPRSNELSVWVQFCGYTLSFIDTCKSPMIIHFIWVTFTNILVIALSRSNK
jgi:hypothetical protein